MATITVNGLESGIFEKLRTRAETRNHSVEEEVKEILRQAVDQPQKRRDLVEIADRIAAMTPKGVKQTDSTILVGEDRGR